MKDLSNCINKALTKPTNKNINSLINLFMKNVEPVMVLFKYNINDMIMGRGWNDNYPDYPKRIELVANLIYKILVNDNKDKLDQEFWNYVLIYLERISINIYGVSIIDLMHRRNNIPPDLDDFINQKIIKGLLEE